MMKSFCKKPLLDVVLKSQVVVRFLRYWSKKGIMYHILNFMSQYCYHSVLALLPRNTMLSLLEEATMDWWLQVTLQDAVWRPLCWRGDMFSVRSEDPEANKHLYQQQIVKISGSRRCCCHWGDCSRIQIFQSKLCSQSSPTSDLQWIGTEEAWAEGVLARDWEVHSHQTWLGAAGEARVSHSRDVW